MEHSASTNQVNLGFRWQVLSSIVVSLLQLAGLILLGRWMNATELGLFTLFQMAYRFGVSVFEPGFYVGLIHYPNSKRDVVEVLNKYQRSLLGVVSVVLLILYIKQGWQSANISVYIFSLACLFVQAFFAIYPVKLTVQLLQKQLAMAQMIAYLIEFIALYILSHYTSPLYVFTIALMIRLVVYYFSCLYYGKGIHLQNEYAGDENKQVIQYSFNFQLNQVLSYFQGIYDNIFIGYAFGLAVLGPYHLACEISYIFFSKINPIFNKAIFPILSKHKEDLKGCRLIVRESLLSFILIMFPIYLWIWYNTPYLVSVIYPNQQKNLQEYMYWILLIAMIKSVNNILFSYILSIGRSKFILLWNISIVLLNYTLMALAFIEGWEIDLFLKVNLGISILSMFLLLQMVSLFYAFKTPLLFLLNRLMVLTMIILTIFYLIYSTISVGYVRAFISGALILAVLLVLFPNRIKLFMQCKIVP